MPLPLLVLLLFLAVTATGFVCQWLDTHPRKDSSCSP